MGFRFTKADALRVVRQMRRRAEDIILLNMQFIGEQFIRDARSTNTYKDETGNLRTSIGYRIVRNGFTYTEGRWELYVKDKGGGTKVIELSRDLMDELSEKFPNVIVLVCVAGMDYAAAVEAKGYDVISNSSIKARDSLKKAIKRVSKKLK